jgi:hypothetical protein
MECGINASWRAWKVIEAVCELLTMSLANGMCTCNTHDPIIHDLETCLILLPVLRYYTETLQTRKEALY